MHLTKTVITFCLAFFYLPSFAQVTAGQDSAKSKIVFDKVEVEAEFPGGVQAWKKYLEKNLKSNIPSNNDAPAGFYRVIVLFIVDKDGSVSEIKAESKLGYGMEDEVVRVINNSGKWSPAVQNGKPVRAYRRQPVIFLVEDDDFVINTKVPYTLFTNAENEITVEAGKVKPENIELTVQDGTAAAKGDGRFIIRVNKPGRTVIEVYNSKKGKEIGKMSFEVRAK